MASPFLLGAAKGFFEGRTEQLEKDKERKERLEDQIRVLQVQALAKQQERYDEINSAVSEIGNNLANGNVEAAAAKAIEARFGGLTAKKFKEVFGNERQAVMDEGGMFDPEVRERLQASLANMVNNWREETKDLDFTAETADVLTSKLLTHKKKFDGISDVVADMVGIKDKTQTFTSPMKGTMKMFRTPSADLSVPTEPGGKEGKPSKRLVTKTKQDGSKVAVMVLYDDNGDPIREGREVVVEPSNNSKVIEPQEEKFILSTTQTLLAEASDEDKRFWDDFVYKNYGKTNDPKKLAPVFEMEFYRSRSRDKGAPVPVHAEVAFRNFMALKDLGILTTTKEGKAFGFIPKTEEQVTGTNVNRFYGNPEYRKTIAQDFVDALTRREVELQEPELRRIKFLFAQFPDLDELY